MSNNIGGFALPQLLQVNNLDIYSSASLSGSLRFGNNSDLVQIISRTIHVSPTGTDNRLSINNYSSIKPFQTIAGAMSSSISGDLIWIHSGFYDFRSQPRVVLRDGVNIYIDPHTILYAEASQFSTFQGFFQDDSGSVTCKIGGYGEFQIIETDFFNNGYAFIINNNSNVDMSCRYMYCYGCTSISLSNSGSNLTFTGDLSGSVEALSHNGGNIKIYNSYINTLNCPNGPIIPIYTNGNITGSIVLENCRFNTEVTSNPITINYDTKNKSMSIYNCIFINGTSTGVIYSDKAGSQFPTASLRIAHCTSQYEFTSSGVTYNITNSISIPYNVIDKNVQYMIKGIL